MESTTTNTPNSKSDPTKQNQDGSPHKVFTICLTGGPCAGKTSSMNYLKEKFSPEFQVYVLPEVAAMTVGSGVSILPSEFTPDNHTVVTVRIFSERLK